MLRSREPIFGPNAKPFFIQFAAGIAIYHALKWLGVGDFVRGLTYYLW